MVGYGIETKLLSKFNFRKQIQQVEINTESGNLSEQERTNGLLLDQNLCRSCTYPVADKEVRIKKTVAPTMRSFNTF